MASLSTKLRRAFVPALADMYELVSGWSEFGFSRRYGPLAPLIRRELASACFEAHSCLAWLLRLPVPQTTPSGGLEELLDYLEEVLVMAWEAHGADLDASSAHVLDVTVPSGLELRLSGRLLAQSWSIPRFEQRIEKVRPLLSRPRPGGQARLVEL